MRRLTVLRTGPQTLVQDLGRPGYAHLGVPPSGALDAPALRLANRLAGNPESAAGLEVLLGGLALRAGASCTVVVTGPRVPVRRNGCAVGSHAPVHLACGDVLEVGTPEQGLRCYLAVSGGIDVPAALGSRSTDLLSGIGPDPVRVDDEQPLGAVTAPAIGVDVSAPARCRTNWWCRCCSARATTGSTTRAGSCAPGGGPCPRRATGSGCGSPGRRWARGTVPGRGTAAARASRPAACRCPRTASRGVPRRPPDHGRLPGDRRGARRGAAAARTGETGRGTGVPASALMSNRRKAARGQGLLGTMFREYVQRHRDVDQLDLQRIRLINEFWRFGGRRFLSVPTAKLRFGGDPHAREGWAPGIRRYGRGPTFYGRSRPARGGPDRVNLGRVRCAFERPGRTEGSLDQVIRGVRGSGSPLSVGQAVASSDSRQATTRRTGSTGT